MKIPNLPTAKLVEETGYPTSTELQFRQNLIQALQLGAGDGGLVAPTQPNSVLEPNVTKIQNNRDSQGSYTCQLGTILYVIPDKTDYTKDKVMIAVRNDNTYPATPPLFKTVTLT